MATVIPAWIKERKSESELAQARKEADDSKKLAASLLIQRDGPEFWERYTNALKVNVDALSEISLRGSMSLAGDIKDGGIIESCCNITVVKEGYLPQQASLNIFYSKKNFGVIRVTQIGGGFNIQLSVSDNKIVVISEDNILTPEKLAEETTEKLVEIVESGKSAF